MVKTKKHLEQLYFRAQQDLQVGFRTLSEPIRFKKQKPTFFKNAIG